MASGFKKLKYKQFQSGLSLQFWTVPCIERRELNIQSIMFLNDLRQNEMYAPHAEIISMCLKAKGSS